MSIEFPFATPVLQVEQSFGDFYVAALPAELLLQVCRTHTISASPSSDKTGYSLEVPEHNKNRDRHMSKIAGLINSADSVFPNSLVLAANHNYETGFDQGETQDIMVEQEGRKSEQASKEWFIREFSNGIRHLIIPSEEKLAAIIDGQNKLFSFTKATPEALRNMSLPCSIYMDLPEAMQAVVYNSINAVQEPVGQTFGLPEYEVYDESEQYWTPDKLAAFLARKLAADPESPLQGHIAIKPKGNPEVIAGNNPWQIPMAVIVNGITRLFSNAPRHDASLMNWYSKDSRERTRDILADSQEPDESPLRNVYIKGNDKLIYTMVLNYLKAVDRVLWNDENKNSSDFKKTMAVQAVFDILRKTALNAYENKDISPDYFENILSPAREIDFAQSPETWYGKFDRAGIRQELEKVTGIQKNMETESTCETEPT